MPDAAPLEPGDPRALGQYEIVGRLGAGGQGAVFLGRAPGGTHVAVKLLHAQMASDPAARARFIREVTAAQKVEAFCTAKVLDADVHGDQPYVISEFIDGPSLHDVVAHNGPFDAAGLERLAIGTATALAAIHEAGIVHRDFKPNNVMLASDGPRVVDFGIARTVNSQESAVTATGMVVGTPGYLAPEQLTGAPLTPAVDIFAWGATMVFAATGQSPFEADTLPVIINKILNDEPDLSRIPAGPVRDMIGRCLSKDAGLRPPAAQLLIHLLQAVDVDLSRQNGGEDLLDQGTRIAAQLPMPPAPQRHITPPPMPMQGTPPPPAQPHITPPPMPMYQNAGMNQPPPPQHGRPPMPMGQPMGGPPPGYAPPPQRSGSGPGLAIGLGCGALALIAIIVVVVLIVIGSNSDPDPDPYTPPSYSPSPSYSGGGGGSGIDIGMIGVWNGTGYQGGKRFTTKFAVLRDNGTATYTYTDGTPTCITRLTLSSGSTDRGSTRAVFNEQPFSPSSTCGAGTLTFLKSSADRMTWTWRGTSGGSAFGTVSK